MAKTDENQTRESDSDTDVGVKNLSSREKAISAMVEAARPHLYYRTTARGSDTGIRGIHTAMHDAFAVLERMGSKELLEAARGAK
jgi:hypothetical protein